MIDSKAEAIKELDKLRVPSAKIAKPQP